MGAPVHAGHMTRSLRLGLALVGLSLPLAADDAEDLAKLHTLVREHADGMTFPQIKSKDGILYDNVVITSVTESGVSFLHGRSSREASIEVTMKVENCPDLWMQLFGFGDDVPKTKPKPASIKPVDSAVEEAIAVIEGDRGAGTGFFCRDGETTYLYSAAHVLSGNTKLKVKLRDGTMIRKFGALEAAEGADLIRLPVNEPVPKALEIGAATGVSKVGTPVLASGNAGGGGTVGFEEGSIVGVGPESIEIDAQVIQGNSGCPLPTGPFVPR